MYAVNSDGSGLRRLVAGRPGLDVAAPLWSPDGSALTFERNGGLYVIKPGATARLITGQGFAPSWSSDSTRIAFADGANIYVVGADGSGETSITRSHRGYDRAPAWSPDGSQLAFLRVTVNTAGSETAAIFVANLDGTGERQLASEACNGGKPAWSPNGKQIGFVGSDRYVYIASADGNTTTRLVERKAGCTLAWSPDGASVAFVFDGIYLARLDGGGIKRLTSAAPNDLPTWSPDGRMLAFAYVQGDISVVNADGSGVRQITKLAQNGYQTFDPQWHPGGVRSEALGGTPVSEATPTDSLARSDLVRTRRTIAQIAVDGHRVAVVYTASTLTCIELWDARSGKLVRFHEETCSYRCVCDGVISEIALGGTQLLWSTYSESNHFYYFVFGATAARPRSTQVFSSSDDQAAGNLYGHGGLLGFVSTWTDKNNRTTQATIWRLVGTHLVRVRTVQGPLTVLAADSHRIATRRNDGAVELLTVQGRPARSFPVGLPERQRYPGEPGTRDGRVAFQGSELVVAKRGTLLVYNTSTGARTNTLPISARAVLEDVQQGIAVYVLGRSIHLLRLSDGRETVINPPGRGRVAAQIEAPGLFYSYNLRAGFRRGRVVFVPFATVVKRLRS